MRFTQPEYTTAHFSEEIFVKCPDCGEMGIVETDLGKYTIPFPYDHKSTFNCKKCGLTENSGEKWFGYIQGVVGSSCGFCGNRMDYISVPTKEVVESVTLKCDSCTKEKDYPLKWHPYKKDKPTDPYFGFDLWLQIDIKEQVLWFYNLEHLRYLKDYVASMLREDDKRHKYSMIANLPQWIKSAKNRDLILKKIERLEKEITKKS